MGNTPKYILSIAFTLSAALGVGLSGCAKPKPADDSSVTPEGEKQEGGAASDDKDVANLCTEYATCNECIAGQVARGKTEGEAQTECGVAVAGCWTTWTKPIVCGDKQYDEQPS